MHDLFVRESGAPESQPIVFLHGLGMSGQMWRAHMAALPEFHCVAPDLPGHGRSASIRWSSRRDVAEAVVRVIEALPEPRTHLVGSSLGGAVAYEVLALRPDLFDRVVIESCAALPTRLAPLIKLAGAVAAPLVRRRSVGRLLARSLGVTDPEGVTELTSQLAHVDPASFRRAFSQAQDVRITESLLAATCPTLLVAGERDLGAVRASNRLLAERMPNAQSWFMPGAGHGWMGKALDVHIAMIRSWVLDEPLPSQLVREPATAAPAVAARPGG